MDSRQLVVAHFKEDITWTQQIQFPFIIYDKSADVWSDRAGLPNLKLAKNKLGVTTNGYISLANIGREAHTYLYHIIINYENLADITVFCQGNPFPYCPNFINEVTSDVIGWKPFGPIFRCFNNGSPHHNLAWLSPFHKILFNEDSPHEYHFVPAANFAVVKDRILARPISFWNQAFDLCINYSERSGLGTNGSPWIFERLWQTIFFSSIIGI
jgi:hypothetical protein